MMEEIKIATPNPNTTPKPSTATPKSAKPVDPEMSAASKATAAKRTRNTGGKFVAEPSSHRAQDEASVVMISELSEGLLEEKKVSESRLNLLMDIHTAMALPLDSPVGVVEAVKHLVGRAENALALEERLENQRTDTVELSREMVALREQNRLLTDGNKKLIEERDAAIAKFKYIDDASAPFIERTRQQFGIMPEHTSIYQAAAKWETAFKSEFDRAEREIQEVNRLTSINTSQKDTIAGDRKYITHLKEALGKVSTLLSTSPFIFFKSIDDWESGLRDAYDLCMRRDAQTLYAADIAERDTLRGLCDESVTALDKSSEAMTRLWKDYRRLSRWLLFAALVAVASIGIATMEMIALRGGVK